MRTFMKGVSLFYGVQLTLASIGLAVYCAILKRSTESSPFEQPGINGDIIVWLAALPQAGVGLLLIYFGLSPAARTQLTKALKQFVEWLSTL